MAESPKSAKIEKAKGRVRKGSVVKEGKSFAERTETTKVWEDADKARAKERATPREGRVEKPEGDEEKSLSKMNKSELLEVVKTEEVTVEDGATNKQIVEAIEAKRKEQ